MAYVGTPIDTTNQFQSLVGKRFSGDASTTAFTLDIAPNSVFDIEVFVENVRQDPNSAYTLSGTTLSFTGAPPSGTNNIYVVHQAKAVGTIDPPATETVAKTFSSTVQFDGTADMNGTELILDADADTSITADTDDQIDFKTGGTDRATIDSSGNVLVKKTSANDTDVGITLYNTGKASFVVAGDATIFNRTSDDGNVLLFRKDGTNVGTINSTGGVTINIDGGGDRCGFSFTASSFTPRKNGSLSDNAVDLGASSYRLDDLYATNGTIQTSDETEKQSIQSLTSTEIAVAKRLSKLFKTFKFNSSVEEKGDNARTHTGIIAQNVKQAFTDEGLDVSNYSLFISTTWWEKERTITGNDGRQIQEKETWETEEEAPEGAVQKTRLGIRYPELLCFISSAFEQRLTNIETRVTTLEG